MRIIVSFLIGFSVGYIGFLHNVSKPESPKVLAERIELTPSPAPTIAPTDEPNTPSPTPTQSPTQKPTNKSTSTPTHTSTLATSSTPISIATTTPKPTATSTPSPTPSPSPTPTPVVPTSTPDVWSPPAMEPWFAQYAGMYGVDKNLLERIANCESHFNPNAVNGDYVGMFQFSTSTWRNYRGQMGADTNPALRTNAEESIKTGAFLVSKRGAAPWPSCI